MEETKLFKYILLFVVLGVVAVFALKIFLFQGQQALPVFSTPLAKIDINWSVLRNQLAVGLPDFEVFLEAIPQQTIASSSVSLQAHATGTAQGFFKYSFDCENDGKYDLETDWLEQKDYIAQNLCVYKEGNFSAKVLVSANLVYFSGQDQEVKEQREKLAVIDIIALSSNDAPVISRCDVAPTTGTTQTNSPFAFIVEANDSNGDELSYIWDFGDGATSTSSSATHVFRSPGFYLPKATVSDSRGAKVQCVVTSLMVLNQFLPFTTSAFSAVESGRQNPFSPTNQEPIPVSTSTSPVFTPAVGQATTTP